MVDLGCGDGRVIDAIPGTAFGCDASGALLAHAVERAPVVQCRLPDLQWLSSGSIAGAYAVLVLEHLPELAGLFAELGRVVGSGGFVAVVANHPAYTAPGAGPVVDPSDGEVLWRWADYFTEAAGEEPAGAHTMTFHHRPLGNIIRAAAASGWLLDTLVERALTIDPQDQLLAGQDRIPRLVGLRWLKSPPLGAD
ncbi:MAG: methyltransferase domain-containing protein [Acidimicrobiia bacterium]|nr:methyltransferase domain-containing protein [Acidimicrobiia bacterium]